MRILAKAVEASLRAKLREAAATAISHDVPIYALEELLREELLSVALLCSAVKMPNGRLNKAKIAAFTGLSRKEVLRLQRAPTGPSAPSRPLLVIQAWRRLTRKRSIPGKLFDQLVREHAHDIPPRAMFGIMQWHGYATETREGLVCLNLRAVEEAMNG